MGWVESVIGILLFLAVVLYLGNKRWYDSYVDIFVLPISIATIFLRWLLKATLFVVLTGILVVIQAISAPPSYLGKVAGRGVSRIKPSPLRSESEAVQRELIHSINEHFSLEVEKESTEYYEELRDLRQSAKKRLERGEKAITIFIGGYVMFLSIYPSLWPLQQTLQRPILLGLQVYLLFMTISIGTRTMLMDHIILDGSEEFSTCNQLRAAVRYQRGLLEISRLQPLIIIMTLVAYLMPSRAEFAFDLFNEYYSSDKNNLELLRDVLPDGWERVQNR